MTSPDEASLSVHVPNVNDFSIFCEGDTVPTLNKKIKFLIAGDVKFIVFLGEDLLVHWACVHTYLDKMPEGYGRVLNQVGLLETQSTFYIEPAKLLPLRRMLGEGVARLFEHQSIEVSMDILDKAEKYMVRVSQAYARKWYLCSSLMTCGVAILVIVVMGAFRSKLVPSLGKDVYEVLLGSFFGAPGALISVFSRTNSIDIDASLGRGVHYLEGAVRIVVAIVGALVVALAIKSDIIGGFTRDLTNPLPFVLLLCLASGASERFLPSLINRLESTVTGGPDTKG